MFLIMGCFGSLGVLVCMSGMDITARELSYKLNLMEHNVEAMVSRFHVKIDVPPSNLLLPDHV